MKAKKYEKIIFIILTLCPSLILLSGCHSRKYSSDFLQGSWYSREWSVTYTISKINNNNWEIKDGDHPIINCSHEYINENNKKEIELISKRGIEFHITPINKTHIKFQQINKNATLGTTATVEFVKK